MAAPDEDEDQWEDVSEEEEEEEEGHISQGASSVGEEEEDRMAQPASPDGPLSFAIPPPVLGTPSSAAEAQPLTPFSPAEGHCPVSDWGEEMELLSPRADCIKTLPVARVAVSLPPGAPGGEEPHVPPSEGGATPEPGEQGEWGELRGLTGARVGVPRLEPGFLLPEAFPLSTSAAMEPGPCLAPSSVVRAEIPDVQQVCFCMCLSVLCLSWAHRLLASPPPKHTHLGFV